MKINHRGKTFWKCSVAHDLIRCKQYFQVKADMDATITINGLHHMYHTVIVLST